MHPVGGAHFKNSSFYQFRALFNLPFEIIVIGVYLVGIKAGESHIKFFWVKVKEKSYSGFAELLLKIFILQLLILMLI